MFNFQAFMWCISVIVLKVSVKVLKVSVKVLINTIQIALTLPLKGDGKKPREKVQFY